MATMIKLAVFDLAGTTLLDTGQVPAAFYRALGANGLTVSTEQLSSVRGVAKREAIVALDADRFGLDDPDSTARTEAIYTAFRADLPSWWQGDQPLTSVRPVPPRRDFVRSWHPTPISRKKTIYGWVLD